MIVEGLAASFREPTSDRMEAGGDAIFLRDSFTDELISDRRIHLAVSHEVSPLAKVGNGLKLWLAADGLHYRAKLDMGNAWHKSVVERIEDGELLGSSIKLHAVWENIRTANQKWQVCTKINFIRDVSIVTSPACTDCWLSLQEEPGDY